MSLVALNGLITTYLRSIPDSKEWDGFKFVDDRLFTPYNKLTFAPSELMKVFYDRQYNRLDRVERQKLRTQVAELRSDDEAKAIREEINEMIKTRQLRKLSYSQLSRLRWFTQKRLKKDENNYFGGKYFLNQLPIMTLIGINGSAAI